jgi:MoaA/NifB/PqqE/SkfB family radical SAM enzyme
MYLCYRGKDIFSINMRSKITTSYLPELAALILGRPKPAMVTVNLTNRCNQNCVYCEIGQDHKDADTGNLSLEDLKWILDEMERNKIRKISLCGGEPFLFDGIIDIVAYAGKKNIRCSITTNGMTAHLLTESELTILHECRTEINISVDSFRNDIQSFTRGTATALPNALKSIEKLTSKHIPVTLLTVVSKYNYSDLSAFFTKAFEKGIKQVLFQPVICSSNYPDMPSVEGKSQMNVSAGQLDLLMDELRKILQFERDHKIRTNVYRIFPWIKFYLQTTAVPDGNWFFKDVLKKFYCREVYAIIDISSNGGIQPCGLTPAFINIHENRQAGLIALWMKATGEIKNNLTRERYYLYCNGCCHHFSRNMLASVMKHPIKNRTALFHLMPLLALRTLSGIMKKIKTSSR